MACRMAEWCFGANMKPMPISSMHCATSAGERSRLTPAASSRSAAPEALETDRLPCLATLAPAPEATRAEAVEMLKVCTASPPVPTTSTSPRRSTSTFAERSRITSAAAAISPTVSPFIRRPMRKPPIWASVASPVMMMRMTAPISSGARSRPSVTARIAPLMSMSASPDEWRGAPVARWPRSAPIAPVPRMKGARGKL